MILLPPRVSFLLKRTAGINSRPVPRCATGAAGVRRPAGRPARNAEGRRHDFRRGVSNGEEEGRWGNVEEGRWRGEWREKGDGGNGGREMEG